MSEVGEHSGLVHLPFSPSNGVSLRRHIISTPTRELAFLLAADMCPEKALLDRRIYLTVMFSEIWLEILKQLFASFSVTVAV